MPTAVESHSERRMASVSKGDGEEGGPSTIIAAVPDMRQGYASAVDHGPRRATNACNVCRRLKMRCVVATSSNGTNAHTPQPPCQRCARVGHVCSFDEALACRKTRRKRKASDQERLSAAYQRIAAMEAELMRQRQKQHLADDAQGNTGAQGGDDGSSSSASSGGSYVRPRSNKRANTFSSTSSITHSTSLHGSAMAAAQRACGGLGSDTGAAAAATRTHDDGAPYPLGLLAEASLHVAEDDSVGDESAAKPRSIAAAATGSTSATVSATTSQHHLVHPSNLRRPRRRRLGVSVAGGAGGAHPFWRGNEPSPTSHEMITSGLVTWQEVETLYGMFFDGPAQHFLTLDADLHTLSRISTRSSVLLTAVSAIGARYYTVRPSLHVELYRTATRLAAMCVVDGVKSVEIVQALLLLCMWPLPSSHWTEDRAWMLSGLALRMATELNLHEHGHAAPASLLSQQQRQHHQLSDDVTMLDELRNRQRVYLTCFAVDRSFSTLQGRNVVLPESRLTINIRNWTTVMPGCKPWDVGIGSFIDLMRTLTVQLTYLHSRRDVRLQGSVDNDTSNDADIGVVDRELLAQVNLFDDQIDQWKEFWSKHGLFDSVSSAGGGGAAAANVAVEQWQQRALDDRLFISLVKQTPLRLGYAKLVINSFGLQHCLGVIARRASSQSTQVYDDSITTDVHVLFSRCWRAARQVVLCALEGLRPAFRYAPATQLLVVCYAAVSLLKLRRHPLLLASVNGVQDDAVQLVVQVAELLDTIALDDSHTPALYASFLWSLVQHAQQQHGSGGDNSSGVGGQSYLSGEGGTSCHFERDHDHDKGAELSTGTAAFDDQVVDALYADANFVRHHIAAPATAQPQQETEMVLASDVLLGTEGFVPGSTDEDGQVHDEYMGAATQDDRGWLQDDLLLGDDFWSMIAPVGLTHSNGTLMPLDWAA